MTHAIERVSLSVSLCVCRLCAHVLKAEEKAQAERARAEAEAAAAHDEAMRITADAFASLRQTIREFRRAAEREREAIALLAPDAHRSRAIMTTSADALDARAAALEALR